MPPTDSLHGSKVTRVLPGLQSLISFDISSSCPTAPLCLSAVLAKRLASSANERSSSIEESVATCWTFSPGRFGSKEDSLRRETESTPCLETSAGLAIGLLAREPQCSCDAR